MSRTQHEIETSRSGLVIVAGLLALLSAILSAAYVWKSLGTDGINAADVALTFAFGVALWAGLFVLHRYAIQVLPRLASDVRGAALAVWLGLATLATFTSIATGSAFLAGGKAQDAVLTTQIEEATDAGNEAVSAQRSAEALIDPIRTTEAALKVMYESERRDGSVCLTGAGAGQCTAVTRTLLESTAATEKQIIESKARAVPLIEAVRREQDQLRRLRDRTDLDFKERTEGLEKSMGNLTLAVNELLSGLPTQAVESLATAYSAEFRQLGLPEIGAIRISGAVSERAGQLRVRLADLREAQSFHVPSFKSNIDAFKAIEMEFGAVWPLIAMAALIDLIPVGLMFVLFLSSRGNDDGPASSSSSGGSGSSGMDEMREPASISAFRPSSQTSSSIH